MISSTTPCSPLVIPEAIKFTNSKGKVAEFYFKNNPWKISTWNDFQKVYRFCIVCKQERFSDKEWSRVLNNMLGKCPALCNKYQCWATVEFSPPIVPQKHFIIQTSQDRSRVNAAKHQEFYEDFKT